MKHFTKEEIEKFVDYLNGDWDYYSDGQIVRAMDKTRQVIEFCETRMAQIADPDHPDFSWWGGCALDFRTAAYYLQREHQSRVIASTPHVIGD